MKPIRVVIVDYGLGNLFSVQRACFHAGLDPAITSDRKEIQAAQAVILPGVGAFGDAMATLSKLDLVEPLIDIAASGKPMLGICLGLQLLMGSSQEFGAHRGLGVLKGTVVRFENPLEAGRRLKVPEICWNGATRPAGGGGDPWKDTPLEGQRDGVPMYFVHSYYVQPEDPGVILSTTRYGQTDYCSSIRHGNLFAFQFHPERSGPDGLRVYEAWARLLCRKFQGES